MTETLTHIRLFDIQRYSVHDGDGIRTNVFLKGCPLACKWCSNPESQSFAFEKTYNASTCMGCQRCVEVCPTGAMTLEGPQPKGTCTLCFRCEAACPTASIRRIGQDWSIDAVLEEVLKDSAFYTVSGGGVTLSGGEPLAQPEACGELAKAIKQLGLHLAIETCGYAPWAKAEPVYRLCDQILYDIKEIDPERHKRFTGVDNALILDNARKAAALESEFIVRVPVIGDYNDSQDTIQDIAEFAAEIGAEAIHLLPFHQLGENKYHRAGLQYTCNAYTPDDEMMRELADVASSCGIPVQIGG
ncbi:MAG: glycyl-radical enzyme activating protein [Phycisphaerales bacterium]|jgi:pyruvate formate lyase activating enzyme|nr:glycyl-radical enzyme activating protein [Phycisphaerales bacterium]MBT7170916.1 glycyl-radical enzyme activating protein [Phycisphaerales bacterium]